jgi:hypothetical protein
MNSERKNEHFCGCIRVGNYYCLACNKSFGRCHNCDVVRVEGKELKFFPIKEMTCSYCGVKGKLDFGVSFVDKERSCWIRPLSSLTEEQKKEYEKNHEVKIEDKWKFLKEVCGYVRTRPLTPEEIKWIVENKRFDEFYRSDEIQTKYDEEKKERNPKLRDIIELEHYRSLPRISRKRWILRKNDYPYLLEDNLEHWILWDMIDGWDSFEVDCVNKVKQFKDLVASWINPPQFRSVNDIPHIHLIFKKGHNNV